MLEKLNTTTTCFAFLNAMNREIKTAWRALQRRARARNDKLHYREEQPPMIVYSGSGTSFPEWEYSYEMLFQYNYDGLSTNPLLAAITAQACKPEDEDDDKNKNRNINCATWVRERSRVTHVPTGEMGVYSDPIANYLPAYIYGGSRAAVGVIRHLWAGSSPSAPTGGGPVTIPFGSSQPPLPIRGTIAQ